MASKGIVLNNSLWQRFMRQGMLMKIILVNVVVFVALRLAVIVGWFCGVQGEMDVLQWVEMPSVPSMLLLKPWTVLTYMISQYEVWHILFNMLWLFWFGIIFVDFFSDRRLLNLYIIGGLAGAALYLVAYNLLPAFDHTVGFLIGSSASVIAIVTATAIRVPDYKMNLFLFGAVSLKWVAIVTIGIDLLSITGGNAGGHLAHLGGALAGAAYVLIPRRKRVRKAPRKEPSRTKTPTDEDTLDAILDKIKKSGYTALTPEERARLFDVSRKVGKK